MAEPESQSEPDFRDEALPHLDALHGLGLRLSGGDEARAEDLVRETVLEAAGAWDRFEAGTDLGTWMMAMLRDLFLDELRRGEDRAGGTDRAAGAGREARDGIEERPVFFDLGDRDPERAVRERLGDEAVVEAVEGLDPEHRLPLVLGDLEGLGYREIAEAMGVPAGTAKDRLFRARRRLQEELFADVREEGPGP